MGAGADNVIELPRRTYLRPGRFEVSTAGFDPNLELVGGDPWGTPDFTGLVVPAAPTPLASFQKRYLFLLARAQFQNGENVRLRGIRQYASLFGDLLDTSNPSVPPVVVATFEKQILSPMFRFPDGNISWHVRVIPKTARDRRNPANADSLIYQDSYSPALLYQSLAPYVPPNGGRPWGKAVTGLGNIHSLDWPWRDSQVELGLDWPVPAPCDVAIFASVAQTDVSTHASFAQMSNAQFAALGPEDAFFVAYAPTARFGRIAASLIFEEQIGSSPTADREERAK